MAIVNVDCERLVGLMIGGHLAMSLHLSSNLNFVCFDNSTNNTNIGIIPVM